MTCCKAQGKETKELTDSSQNLNNAEKNLVCIGFDIFLLGIMIKRLQANIANEKQRAQNPFLTVASMLLAKKSLLKHISILTTQN